MAKKQTTEEAILPDTSETSREDFAGILEKLEGETTLTPATETEPDGSPAGFNITTGEAVQPAKKTRKPRAKKAEPAPEPLPPVQFMDGNTLMGLIDIAGSRIFALASSWISKNEISENTIAYFQLSEQEKAFLAPHAEKAAEKIGASGDPITVLLSGLAACYLLRLLPIIMASTEKKPIQK